MSEEVKTVSLLGGALVAAIVAFVVSREAPERTAAQEVGKPFVEIENPLEVKRLKIVKFDADAGRYEPFEVAQVGGLYSIPSHENYPADARDHLVDAVNFVNDVKILASVSDSSGSHEDFGVVDPTSESLGRGASGAGTRVTMSDADSAPLADFIIGKKVKDAEGQHYVRYADKDQVYTVEIDPSRLSTRFEDWIERDLLKLDSLDVKKVAINDYTVQTRKQPVLGPEGLYEASVVTGLEMKSAADLTYDSKDLEWKLDKLVLFEENRPQESDLADDEELDKTKLNDLKSSVDDLQIVDVRRKAKGLGSDLSEFIKENPDAISNLETHGFYFRGVEGPDGKPQYMLLSNNGEITVGMKDGVEYVMRFGNVAGAEKAEEQKDDHDHADEDGHKHDHKNGDHEHADGDHPDGDHADGDHADGDKDEQDRGTKVLRYLFVLAQLNPDLIEKPELEEVPPEEPPTEETKAEETKAEETKAEETKAEETKGEETKGEEGKGDEAKTDETKADSANETDANETDADETKVDESKNEEVSSEETKTEEIEAEESKTDEAPADDSEPAAGDPSGADAAAADSTDSAATDSDKADADQADTDKATTDKADTDKADTETESDKADEKAEDPAQKLAAWKEKRQSIIDENERKQKEYDDQVAAAKKRVEELNERFSAWYYVISDDTYHKIHLGRDEIIKKKEKTEEEKKAEEEANKDSLEQFNDLKQGLPPE